MFELKTVNKLQNKVIPSNEDYKLIIRNEDYIRNNVANIEVASKVECLNIDSFSGNSFYPSVLVEQDKQEAISRYEKFVQSGIDSDRTLSSIETQRGLARIQEVLLAKIINDNDYFNEESVAQVTTDYDDTFNHCDVVSEYKGRENDDLADNVLGYDVTYSKEQVARKLEKVERSTRFLEKPRDQGIRNFWEIKYYKSKYSNQEPEPIENAAKIVIGFSSKHILEFAKLVLREAGEENGNCIGLNEKYDINNHPLKLLVLEEKVAQTYFLKEMSKINRNEKLKRKYLRLFHVFEAKLGSLLTEYEKTEEGRDFLNKYNDYRNEDVVYQNMMTYINQRLQEENLLTNKFLYNHKQ